MNLHNVSQVSSFVVVREWISLMELQSMSDFRKEIVYACRQISIFHYLVFEIFMATFAVIIFANPILCFFFFIFFSSVLDTHHCEPSTQNRIRFISKTSCLLLHFTFSSCSLLFFSLAEAIIIKHYCRYKWHLNK